MNCCFYENSINLKPACQEIKIPWYIIIRLAVFCNFSTKAVKYTRKSNNFSQLAPEQNGF